MLDLNGTLGGLLLQQSLYASSGNACIQKQNAYTFNDQLVENLYFNDNNGYNNNNNSNNNNNNNNNTVSNDNDSNDNKSIGGALQQNHGGIDNQILNASFDLGSQQFVDNQWSLEEFLLGGGALNGLVNNHVQQPQQTYVHGLSSNGSSPYNSTPQSPQTPLSPQSPQDLQNLQSPHPVQSPAPSTNSSLDDLLDDLELVSPYGSPPTADGFLAGGSPGSPGSFVGSPYGSSSASSPASSGSPYGLGSPYGSPGSSVTEVDPLEEILNGLAAPMDEEPAEEIKFQVNNQLPMEVTTSEVVEASYPSLSSASPLNTATGNIIAGNYSLVDLLTNNCNPFSSALLGSGIPTTVESIPSATTVDLSLLQLLQSSQPIKAEANVITNQAQNQVVDPVVPTPAASPNHLLNLNLYGNSPSPSSPASPASLASPASSVSPAVGTGGKEERRYAPYKGKAKPRTEAQKERKKEHNRKSASKYRSKKKQELEVKTSELDELEEKNVKLKGTVEDLRKEIDYLKTLMLDVIKARMEKKEKEEKKVTSPAGDVDISALLAALAK